MLSHLPLSYLGVVILTMLVSITLHEALHGYAAHMLGDETAAREGRLSLNPLKHIDLLMTIILPAFLIAIGAPPIFVAKPVPFDPRNVRHEEFGVALVGLAGPATNLGLAVLAAAFGHLSHIDLASTAGDVLIIFITINVALCVFNMIPLPPLDGSRLLYAFAPEPIRRIMEQIEGAGFWVVIIILIVLSPVIGPIVTNITNTITTFLLR